MTKRIFGSALCAMLLVGFANAANYDIDVTHSSTNFKIKHLSVSNVTGSFDKFSGIVDIENGIPKKIDTIINVDSINTSNTARDNHLKQADFFDIAKFPEMKFVMTEFKKDGDNEGKIIGNLTIKNVTKPVTLNYEFGGQSKNQKGIQIVGFSLEGKIKRSDFSFAPDTSTLTLGDEIKINIEVEAAAK